MKNNEKQIIEGVRSFLGLDHHDHDKINRLDLGGQHVQSHISELFKLKAASLIHHDTIVSAFNKTQHNMYLDDPAFAVTFMKEMTGRAVPKPEIMAALKFADDVLDKAAKEFDSSSTKDAGWNQNLEDIKEVSQPEQNTEFETVKQRKGHEQKSNITSDMPMDRPKAKRITESKQINESSGEYETTIEVETPYELVSANVILQYNAEPIEKATRDYPGSPGGISIHNFTIKNMTIYDIAHNYMEQTSGRLTPEGYKELITNEIKSREDDLETSIGEYLHEKDITARYDYYDRKRRERKEEGF